MIKIADFQSVLRTVVYEMVYDSIEALHYCKIDVTIVKKRFLNDCNINFTVV